MTRFLLHVVLVLAMGAVIFLLLVRAVDARVGVAFCQWEDGSYSFVDPDTPQPGCQRPSMIGVLMKP